MKLTDEELAAMPAKSTRFPDEVELYRKHGFLTAYGLHTDKRIKETGYRAAIGGGDNWEQHGQLQLAFLKSQGLLPPHDLLDVGCGTGRLARKAAPYLATGCYYGLDISLVAIAAAIELSKIEGWSTKDPHFLQGNLDGGLTFDFIWAFSVMIHIPQAAMEDVMRRVTTAMHADSKFFFSYVPNKAAARTGLKQFRKPLEDYQRAAAQAGLTFEEMPNWVQATIGEAPDWAGHQRVALARLVR